VFNLASGAGDRQIIMHSGATTGFLLYGCRQIIKGGGELKTIRCNLPRELEYIEIHTFADLHNGDANCNIKLVRERIAEVVKNKNAYCILNGDIFNMASRTSVSDIYLETIPPMEQLKRGVEMFGPIANKILYIGPGNHELRAYKSDGIDITALLATQLGIADKYSDTTGLLFIRCGKERRGRKETGGDKTRQICYTVYITHGTGSGRKEGGKINRLADLAAIVDADIYIHSHTHLPAIIKEGYYRTDIQNSTARFVDKLFINTGATLDYGGYGDIQGFKPTSKDTPVIYLDGRKKRTMASL